MTKTLKKRDLVNVFPFSFLSMPCSFGSPFIPLYMIVLGP